MKVIHIESGLGNQMLSYAEYLVMKKLNPQDDCFIETMIYELPECNNVICQWFGYELERIFGVKAPNIRDLFSKAEWDQIVNEVRLTEFWNDGWRYAPAITDALNRHGLHLKNIHGDEMKYVEPKDSFTARLLEKRLVYELKRIARPLYQESYRRKMDTSSKIFIKSKEDIFAGQMLGLRNYGVDIDFIRDELLNSFVFPPVCDQKTSDVLSLIRTTESVAIHARRGDMLQSNGYCYRYGYFKRAVKYIKKRIHNPVFFFFCDSDSIEWCKSNSEVFHLDFKRDNVFFVDWNTGLDYYRDMQLMGECKHNIITNSSFGWWGTFFNKNPRKITISPNVWNNTNVQL